MNDAEEQNRLKRRALRGLAQLKPLLLPMRRFFYVLLDVLPRPLSLTATCCL